MGAWPKSGAVQPHGAALTQSRARRITTCGGPTGCPGAWQRGVTTTILGSPSAPARLRLAVPSPAGRLDHEHVAGRHLGLADVADLLDAAVGPLDPVASLGPWSATGHAERRVQAVVGQDRGRHRFQEAHLAHPAVAAMPAPGPNRSRSSRSTGTWRSRTTYGVNADIPTQARALYRYGGISACRMVEIVSVCRHCPSDLLDLL